MEANTIIKLHEDPTHELEEKLRKLDTVDKDRVNQITDTIQTDNPQNVIQFGIQAQTKISNFADTVISEYKNKDTGYVGEIVKDLMMQVKNVNMNELSDKKKGFFAKSKSKMNNFVANFENVSSQIDKIIRDMENARLQLMKDISMLDVLYEKNKLYIKDLDLFIIAGSVKLQELDQQTIPLLKQEMAMDDDLFKAQKLQETLEFRGQFEKKLHDLKLTRQISIQALPQVRLISITNQELVNSIQSSVINTIPLWKNAVINAVTLTRQKKALEMQKSVNDMTNELLLQNSKILKENTITAAAETQRGIVDIETLQQVNSDLIETIETVQQICYEGQEKRRAAELELVEMETNLKKTIMSH